MRITISFVLSLALLIACSKGGGGSDISDVPLMQSNDFPQADKFQDVANSEVTFYSARPDYEHQPGLTTINAAWAYARGKKNAALGFGSGTGKDVVIGVWDTGLDHTHTNFNQANKIDSKSMLGLYYSNNALLLLLFPIRITRFPNIPTITGSQVSAIKRYPVAVCSDDRGLSCSDNKLITLGDTYYFISDNVYYTLPFTLYQHIDGRLIDQHKDFLGRGNLVHGTSVASIAAASYNPNADVRSLDDTERNIPKSGNVHGVAFEASVLTHTIDSDIYKVPIEDKTNMVDVIHFYNGKSDIVNISSGTHSYPEDYDEAGLRLALPKTIAALAQSSVPKADRTIYVRSAGNEGQSSPSILASLPYFISELHGHHLAVVSIDIAADGSPEGISSFSNLCGVMKEWCLVAPGGKNVRVLFPSAYTSAEPNIALYYLGNSEGTSFAAPYVAGALAVVKNFFNGQLGNDEIVLRLLLTANKDGIYADSDIYGQGLLDLKKATEPSGNLRMVGGSGFTSTSFSTSSSKLYHSGAFGDALNFEGQWLTAFDDLDAPFPMLISDFVIARSVPKVALGERLLPFSEQQRSNQYMIAIAWSPQEQGNVASGAFFAKTRFSNQDVFWSYRVHPSYILSQEALNDGLDFSPSRHHEFSAPWLAFASESLSLGISMTLGDLPLTMIGFLQSPEHQNVGVVEEQAAMQGFVFDLGIFPEFHFQLGFLNEASGMLGGLATGAMHVGDVQTWFMGSKFRFTLGGFDGAASVYLGLTDPTMIAHSMFQNMSLVYSTGFSVGVMRSDILLAGDRLSVFVNQKLRVERGRALLNFAKGRTRYRDLIRHQQAFDLEPSGRAIELETSYLYPLAERLRLALSMAVIHQPKHESSTAPELLFKMRLFSHF